VRGVVRNEGNVSLTELSSKDRLIVVRDGKGEEARPPPDSDPGAQSRRRSERIEMACCSSWPAREHPPESGGWPATWRPRPVAYLWRVAHQRELAIAALQPCQRKVRKRAATKPPRNKQRCDASSWIWLQGRPKTHERQGRIQANEAYINAGLTASYGGNRHCWQKGGEGAPAGVRGRQLQTAVVRFCNPARN